MSQADKNGSKIRFCSLACYHKNMSGENNPMWGKKHTKESLDKFKAHPNRQIFKSGEDNPNFSRFGKDFDPKTAWLLRKRLIASIGQCQRCGWGVESGILQIHHKDRNPKNNARENVELLCPICHELDHFANKDGRFHGKKNKHTFVKVAIHTDSR